MKITTITIFILLASQIVLFAENNPKPSPKAKQLVDQHITNIRGVGETNLAFKNKRVEIVVYTAVGPCFDTKDAEPGSCGNYYATYLMAIVDNKPFEPIQVGGKGMAHINGINFENGLIVLNAMKYTEDDPMCCPSQKSTIKYKIDKSKIVKVLESKKVIDYAYSPADKQSVEEYRKLFASFNADEIARQTANEVAKNLPQQINRYMNFNSVFHFGNEVIFRMSFDTREMEDPMVLSDPRAKQKFIELAKGNSIKDICTDPAMFVAMEKGLIFKIQLSMSYANDSLEYEVSINDCK